MPHTPIALFALSERAWRLSVPDGLLLDEVHDPSGVQAVLPSQERLTTGLVDELRIAEAQKPGVQRPLRKNISHRRAQTAEGVVFLNGDDPRGFRCGASDGLVVDRFDEGHAQHPNVHTPSGQLAGGFGNLMRNGARSDQGSIPTVTNLNRRANARELD